MTARVAVTGATGFIGTALVRELARRGYQVAATDRFEPTAELPVARFIRADIGDERALRRTLEGVQVVHHLAALPAIARAPEAEYRRVNADATERVLELAAELGVGKVVHMSSSTVFGIPDVCPIPEDAPRRPACPYSRSKAAAEEACERHAAGGLDVTVIRPRVVMGPGRAGIFALLFACIRESLPVPLVGSGGNRFQFTAVDDLVRACLLAAQERGPGCYNIGCRVERSLAAELEALIAHAGSRSRLMPLPARPLTTALAALHRLGLSPLVPEQYRIADADFVLDTARAQRRLGFEPTRANGDGLLRAWDWWAANASRGKRDLWRWRRPTHQNALQRRPG